MHTGGQRNDKSTGSLLPIMDKEAHAQWGVRMTDTCFGGTLPVPGCGWGWGGGGGGGGDGGCAADPMNE